MDYGFRAGSAAGSLFAGTCIYTVFHAWWGLPFAIVGAVIIGQIANEAERMATKERARKRVASELAESIWHNPQAREDWEGFLRDCQIKRNAPRN